MSSLIDDPNAAAAFSEEMRQSSGSSKDNETVFTSDKGDQTMKNEENAASTVSMSVTTDEFEKGNVNLIFIGHVDAGKSTLRDQLLHQTGMFKQKTLEEYETKSGKNEREGLSYAYVWNTNEYYRKRGKTVKCGRAYFKTEKRVYTIIDAPGHKDYIPNMINGASQADVAVIIVSARHGEFEAGFEYGQTKLHSEIVKEAGVKRMIVLVNKMDDPTVNWDEEKWRFIQEQLTLYLKYIGFDPKTDIAVIPISAMTGAFIKESKVGEGDYYKGPCLIDYLDNHLPSMNRDSSGPLRARIVEKCQSEMGMQCYVKMDSGVVQKGQNLILMPDGRPVQVVQMWLDDVERHRAATGDIVKVKLQGVENGDIKEGFVLCEANTLCKVGRLFDAEVVTVEQKLVITAGYSCTLHIHSVNVMVNVKKVICAIDEKTGSKTKRIYVKEKEKCILRLESATPFCLESFKDFPQLGRFILRNGEETVAFGKVKKVLE